LRSDLTLLMQVYGSFVLIVYDCVDLAVGQCTRVDVRPCVRVHPNACTSFRLGTYCAWPDTQPHKMTN